MDPHRALSEIADGIRDDARRAGGLLDEPLSGLKELLDSDDLILSRLLVWGIFNPFGPTIGALSSFRLDSDEFVLTLQIDNPFAEEGSVLGLVPGEESAVPLSVLERLFGSAGPEGHPLFASLPSHLIHNDNMPEDMGTNAPTLGAEECRELMWIATTALGVTDRELQHTVELLRQFPLDPWGRAGRERDEALTSPETVRLLEAIRRLNAGLPADEAPVEAEDEPAAERSTFDEWFDLVTDPEHVRVETREMPVAWAGALRFVAGSTDE
jgi:hypothetical protein